MSNDGVNPDPTMPTEEELTEASATIPQGTSLEQSVRLFKIFEALRGGDTAALSAAVQAQGAKSGKLEGTTVLHLAVQCAEPSVVEYVLRSEGSAADLNTRDRDGNTPLHIASSLGRSQVVSLLLDQGTVNDSITNFQGKTPLDVARTPEVFQQLQLSRSMFVDSNVKKIQVLVRKSAYSDLETLLADPKIRSTVDVNGGELATEPQTIESGGSLLHEAARKRDIKLCQLLLLNGADPFRRDRKGKLPQDVTKDDRTRAILKRSPAAAAAQRGIQEKTILGTNASQQSGTASGEVALGSKEARETKGYLKKWTNYTSGYKLRWFVLEDGVLSYYKHQDDAGSACRGAINMRIAKLHMDPKDKLGFEIHGKSSVKYHLKANHEVEAKRWFWSLNNAIQWCKDEAREEKRRQDQGNETLRQARSELIEKTQTIDSDAGSTLVPSSAATPMRNGSIQGMSSVAGDAEGSVYATSTAGDDLMQLGGRGNTATIDGDADDDEEDGDDASSHEAQPANKDAFNITAQSARLQLDLLAQVATALQTEKQNNPNMVISHPSIDSALTSYELAVQNLKGLVLDLLRISRDHEAYWQYRLDREANVRRLWEDSMARVAREQEELQSRMGESEDKRRRTKRALREALEGQTPGMERSASQTVADPGKLADAVAGIELDDDKAALPEEAMHRRTTIANLTNNEISDDESDIDDEFFDAVGAGEVEVAEEMPANTPSQTPAIVDPAAPAKQGEKSAEIAKSYRGYEDGIRKRLKLDADNRPKVSLWVSLLYLHMYALNADLP